MYYINVISITLICSSFYYPPLFFLGLGLGVFSFFSVVSFSKFYLDKKCVIFFIIVLGSMIPSFLYFHDSLYNFKKFALIISMLFTSYSLALTKRGDSDFLTFSWFPLTVSLAILAIKASLGISAENVFPENSSNYISITLFGAYLSYFILTKDFRLSKIHSVFTFLILVSAIYAEGRAGVLLSSLLFSITTTPILIPSFRNLSPGLRKTIKASLFVVLIASIILGFIYLYYNGFLSKLVQRGLYNGPRLYIIYNYILQLAELNSIIFGLNVNEFSAFGLYGFNLHNSYLDVHSYFGITFFFLYLAIISYSFFVFWKEGYRYFSLVLLILLLRATTDTQIFVGRFDYIFFTTFMLLVISRRIIR